MPHHKHSAMVVVVGVRGVVGDLSAYEGRVTLLFSTLCLVVAKLATIYALTDLFCQFGMTWLLPLLPDTPPRAFVKVLFPGLPLAGPTLA